MPDLILHHYPPSPVSEKVRIVFGIKRLAWRSVEIPRVPPRPLLFPMTGGYRRTPVLQVGADIYCDSSLIVDELERRHPSPALYPDGERGLALGLGRWLNGPLFDTAVAVVLGGNAASLPEAFARDRVTLYFGADAKLEDLVVALPHQLGQLAIQLGWLAERLRDGREYFCGRSPGLQDALVWYLAWFLAGRYGDGRAMIDRHAVLAAWYKRMEAIGHGEETAMSGEEALALGTAATPPPMDATVADNPAGLVAGQPVTVTPEGRGLDPAVAGVLLALDDTRIVLRHLDDQAGEFRVHFPRVGYRLSPA